MDRPINHNPGTPGTPGVGTPTTPGIATRFLITGVHMYQVMLGPLMGGHCRFMPTCSVYSIEALQTHGAIKGTWLTIRRIIRCQPWGGSGYDPVPCLGKDSKVISGNSDND